MKPKSKAAKKADAPVAELAQDSKQSVGRPTDYRPEHCRLALMRCLLGATDEELAEFLGISKQTLYNWQRAHPEFLDSVNEGKELADANVAYMAHKRATGYSWQEEVPIKLKDITYDDKGKKIREVETVQITLVTKHVPPDPTTIQFWLKNRKHLNWRDRREVEIGRPGDFAAMQDDELLKYIQQEATDLVQGLDRSKAERESDSRMISKGTSSKH